MDDGFSDRGHGDAFVPRRPDHVGDVLPDQPVCSTLDLSSYAEYLARQAARAPLTHQQKMEIAASSRRAELLDLLSEYGLVVVKSNNNRHNLGWHPDLVLLFALIEKGFIK